MPGRWADAVIGQAKGGSLSPPVSERRGPGRGRQTGHLFGTQINRWRPWPHCTQYTTSAWCDSTGPQYMTTQYVLQFIAGRRPCGVDEADLPWQSVPGHVYADQGEGWAAVDEFDAAFDHRYTHRIKPVDVEDERATEPAPPPVAAAPPPPPPPAKKTVVRKVLLNRQLVEHRAQQAFDRNLGLLRLELGLESARRHLDPLLELCDMYLASAGSSLLTQRYREQLTEVRALVAARGNLRLVK